MYSKKIPTRKLHKSLIIHIKTYTKPLKLTDFQCKLYTNHTSNKGQIMNTITNKNQEIAIVPVAARSQALYIGGCCLGASLGQMALRQATTTMIAMGAIEADEASIDKMNSARTIASTVVLTVGVVALATDLATERKLFKQVDVVAKGAIETLQLMGLWTARAMLGAVVYTVGKRALGL